MAPPNSNLPNWTSSSRRGGAGGENVASESYVSAATLAAAVLHRQRYTSSSSSISSSSSMTASMPLPTAHTVSSAVESRRSLLQPFQEQHRQQVRLERIRRRDLKLLANPEVSLHVYDLHRSLSFINGVLKNWTDMGAYHRCGGF